MIKARKIRWTTVFALVFGYAACQHGFMQQATHNPAARLERAAVAKGGAGGALAAINDWHVSAIREEHLHKIQMPSDTRGWTASTEGSLYQTIDGGDTWRRVDNFKVPEDFHITDFNFSAPWGVDRGSKDRVTF